MEGMEFLFYFNEKKFICGGWRAATPYPRVNEKPECCFLHTLLFVVKYLRNFSRLTNAHTTRFTRFFFFKLNNEYSHTRGFNFRLKGKKNRMPRVCTTHKIFTVVLEKMSEYLRRHFEKLFRYFGFVAQDTIGNLFRKTFEAGKGNRCKIKSFRTHFP